MNEISSSSTQSASVSRAAFWTGCVFSAVPVLMLIMSGVMKLVKPPALVEGIEHLGWPLNYALGLGTLELACVVVYLIPRTAVLGQF